MFRSVVLAGLATAALALSGCGEAPQVTAPVKQAPPVQQVEPAPVAEVAPEPAPDVVEPTAEVVEPAPEVVEPSDPAEDAAVDNGGWAPGQHDEFVDQMREHLRENGTHPNYGVVDGSIDGPGYLDPDVYGGDPSSGETQRAWLEQQGLL